MDSFYVYVHRRADSGLPFYVGKGKGDRLNRSTSRNRHWHSIVAKCGAFEAEVIVEKLDEEFSFLIEVELIDKLRRFGVKLANATIGGEGVTGFTRKQSAEEIAKRAAANTGRKRTPEQRARIAMAKAGHGLGSKQSQDLVERRISPLRGRCRPLHVIAAFHSALKQSRQPRLDAIREALLADKNINQAELSRRLRCGRQTIRKMRDRMICTGEI